jgi:hypothetical protein
MVRKWIAPAIAVALMVPAAVQAKWLKAESQHYIVYSEDSEQNIRHQAERLEKLNLLQHAITGLEADKPSVKVKVFVVGTYGDVQATMPFPSGGVAGYYDANVRGPYSVISRESDSGHGFSAQLVLFHELTHHFMFQNYNVAYPIWYVEGFAEFIGASKVDDSNSVIVGQQSVNRYYTFHYSSWVPVREILTARSYDDMKDDLGSLYAEGWLLTHYLQLGGKRDGQLAKYLTDINAGKSYEQAAKDAFGDLNKLDAELHGYSLRSQLPATGITFKPTSIQPIKVEEVPAGQAAMMIDDVHLFAGIPQNDAKSFAARVRTDAARAGESAFTLRLRAEADRLADDHADYAATVTRWSAVAPDDPQAMLHQALLQMDALRDAKSTDAAAWTKARRMIVTASRKAPADAVILKAYFDSFKMQGIASSADAHNALFRALDLVPADGEVRYQLASDFEAHGDIKDAIAVIRLSAFTEKDNLTAKERAKRDKDEAHYRLAGIPKHETARDMLDRLLKAQESAGTAS